MTKLMNYVLILLILCCGLHLSKGETLKCQFFYSDYHIIGSLYSCYVTSLDNSFNKIRIDGYTGQHKNNKNNSDVQAIDIQGKNLKYIPANLGSLSSLLALTIRSSQLVEIKAKDFLGMRNLEYLNLVDNKLTSVPSDAFLTLTKLKVISLFNNQIEEISSELFSNNLNLKEVDFDKNKIRYIGSELFNGLIQLNNVDLNNNICVSKVYNGTTISDLKQEIKMNCDKSNDVIENKILKEFEVMKKKSDETEKKIEMQKKEIETLNEMMKQLLKISQERQQVRF